MLFKFKIFYIKYILLDKFISFITSSLIPNIN